MYMVSHCKMDIILPFGCMDNNVLATRQVGNGKG